MATPFSLQGTFVFPPDDGEPNATRKFSQSGSFTQKSEHDVAFGTITAPKAIVLEVDSSSLGPVNMRVNGGTDNIEISPGGFVVYSNPVPDAPITELALVHTVNARVQVRLLE